MKHAHTGTRSRSLFVVGSAVLSGLLLTTTAAEAQSTRAAGKPRAASGANAKSGTATDATLQGAWNGLATVQLGDSAITVPVMYTFVTANGATSGTAVVPGQGSGQISNVVRDGARLRFRVTAPEGRLLEHDGQVAADQVIEGMVYMDQKPLAKFRISPAKSAPTTPTKPPAKAPAKPPV